MSDCESESNRDYDHRPKYIKTAQNRYYEMKYYETRNMFTKAKVMIFNCSGFQPGQYSFPFSFKTFEGWPASFNYSTPKKKGVIIYHMVAAIEPVAPDFKLQGGREIILRETRVVQARQESSSAEVKDCCCINKGFTSSVMTYSKDGFTPGEMVGMAIEVDNTQCAANIKSITVSVNNIVTLRSQGRSTSDSRRFFSKTLNGVMAGEKLEGAGCINETFQMPNNPEIKPTCSGSLLSSQYSISIALNHEINCSCCSDKVGSTIPIVPTPRYRSSSPLSQCTRCHRSSRQAGHPNSCPLTNCQSPTPGPATPISTPWAPWAEHPSTDPHDSYPHNLAIHNHRSYLYNFKPMVDLEPNATSLHE